MNKDVLINSELPLITEYNDMFENSSIEEVFEHAKNNNPVAIYELAYRYRCGEGGVEQDIHKAMLLYKKVLEYQKNTCAMYRLGYGYLYEMDEEEKGEEGIGYFEAAAALGDVDSVVQLGLLYDSGRWVEKNYDKALELYKFAVEHGRKDAYGYMGDIYRYKGMIDQAIECYKLSLENDNLYALLPLGWFYEDGTGVEKDEKKAYELYKQAYENGNPDSAYYLGRMYYLGRGTEESDAKAFLLLKEASERGNKNANCFLGSLYGWGVEGILEKNIDIAMKYLSDVSDIFEVNAWYTKGRIYLSEKKYDEAKKWLEKAAEAGHEDAKDILEQLSKPQKSLQELAEEGSNPNAMIQYACSLMTNSSGNKMDIHKAREIITRAEQLYPDNLEVKEWYLRILFYHGHIEYKIGAYDDSWLTLRKGLSTIELLKRNNYKLAEIREIEIDLCMDYGEVALKKDETEFALKMLARTDFRKYPYATVLTTLTHLENPYKYAENISDDIAMINKAINTNNWTNHTEKATAYFVLSTIYAQGIAKVIPVNVNYAYECIQRCAELDFAMAEEELKKYSKGLFGIITYRK